MLMDEDKKKSFIEKVLCAGLKNERKLSRESCKISEQPVSTPQSTGFIDMGPPSQCNQQVKTLRIFVATWNVGGKSPHQGLALDDFLCTREPSDIYVLGFQEIVPLNAGNVLVIEDNEPAAKWLALINHSLNHPPGVAHRGLKHANALSNSPFFVKPSLKRISKTFRTESGRRLKACNCKYELERKGSKDFCFPCQPSTANEDDLSSEDDDDGFSSFDPAEVSNMLGNNQMKYSMIAGKQMVGLFLTVWARTELIHYVGHLRTSCIGRGVMGYLGNKGCISVRMSLHQTSFCFICSHLTSGEKEGDELRRNLDVIEILRHTQFRKICRTTNSRMPVKILEHDHIIWLGDLNYRIALSYAETRKLMQEDNWDALLEKDQLKIEREAGRVFKGWKEGKIKFPPTYKYSNNSDVYAGDNIKSKHKRRTPAWCDRILWHGNGIQQLMYIREESRLSDHRPVCADFLVEVMVSDTIKELTPRH